MKADQGWTEFCRTMAPSIVEACTAAPVNAGPDGLIGALKRTLPDWKFRHTLTRGGWYRLGAVVDAEGKHVSTSLEDWAEQGVDAHDGDLGAFRDAHLDDTLYATRFAGRTHYLVASVSGDDDDYLQLEIEDLQEMRAHQLFENDPGSIEELVDPEDATASQPIGLPTYRFRRVQHIGSFLKRMAAQSPEKLPIQRMLNDWGASSAGATAKFSLHWVVATREHLDRFHQTVRSAKPIPALSGGLPEFEAEQGDNGVALQRAIRDFDHALGYPMAWFFHMMTSRTVPHWVAQTAVEDSMADYAYLPERDLEIVRNWLHRPYSF